MTSGHPSPRVPGRRGRFRAVLVALLLALPVLAAVAAESGWWEYRVVPTLRLLADPHSRVVYAVPQTQGRRIALTIDDGPDPATTPAILDVLERHGARATFFLISSRAEANAGLVSRIVAEGHEIGNHMTADRPSIDLGPAAFERQLARAHETLSRWQSPLWFRPASGWYDEAMLAIAERHGYRTVLGRIYPMDAAIESPSFAAAFIRWQASPGGIVILHDVGSRGRNTVETLERVLPALDGQGFEVVSLSGLYPEDSRVVINRAP